MDQARGDCALLRADHFVSSCASQDSEAQCTGIVIVDADYSRVEIRDLRPRHRFVMLNFIIVTGAAPSHDSGLGELDDGFNPACCFPPC
jgi:hypothetical protein